MITAHKKHHGKSIPKTTKLAIALQAIKGKKTISAISKEHDVSRTTVYLQQEKALNAANQAFEEKDDDVLFYIPVTKAFLYVLGTENRIGCAHIILQMNPDYFANGFL